MTPEFKKDLAELINRHSLENGSNTPDFILADYLFDCLEAFNRTSSAREKFYGKGAEIIYTNQSLFEGQSKDFTQ